MSKIAPLSIIIDIPKFDHFLGITVICIIWSILNVALVYYFVIF
jgi:hypothetical protein